jgi:hypothetical protein
MWLVMQARERTVWPLSRDWDQRLRSTGTGRGYLVRGIASAARFRE